jgi:hypothetical protein
MKGLQIAVESEAGCTDRLVFSRECTNLSALVQLLHDFGRRPRAAARADEIVVGMCSDRHTSFAVRVRNVAVVPVFHHVLATSAQNLLKNSFGMPNINKSNRFEQLFSNYLKRRFIMKVLQARDYFLDYQKMNAKKKYHEEL